MKTDIHVWSYVAQVFLEWEMFQTKVVEKFETHTLCSSQLSLSLYLLLNLLQCSHIYILLRRGAHHRILVPDCINKATFPYLFTRHSEENITSILSVNIHNCHKYVSPSHIKWQYSADRIIWRRDPHITNTDNLAVLLVTKRTIKITSLPRTPNSPTVTHRNKISNDKTGTQFRCWWYGEWLLSAQSHSAN